MSVKILSHPGHGYPMRVELRATGRRESLPRRLNNHLHAVRTKEAPFIERWNVFKYLQPSPVALDSTLLCKATAKRRNCSDKNSEIIRGSKNLTTMKSEVSECISSSGGLTDVIINFCQDSVCTSRERKFGFSNINTETRRLWAVSPWKQFIV